MRVCPERGRPCFNPPQPPDDYPLSTPSSSPSFSSSSSSCLLVLPNLFILHNSPSKSVLLRLVALMTRGHQQRDALSSASVLQRCDLILHARPYQRFQTVRQLCSVVLACGAHMCVSVVFAMVGQYQRWYVCTGHGIAIICSRPVSEMVSLSQYRSDAVSGPDTA
eukprot:1336703-Rhodomonas_salina.3